MITANRAMDLLRYHPEEAFSQCAFIVENEQCRSLEGGKCTAIFNRLEKTKNPKNDDIFKIMLQYNCSGQDFYYPFLNGLNAIGSCLVPKNSPVGTLVFTSGMNGCSLQVDNDGQNLKFMHCNNGCGASNINTLCRIDYKHYAGFFRKGQTRQDDTLGIGYLFLSKSTGLEDREIGNYAYYLITVKTWVNWVVYASCILKKRSIDDIYYRVPGTTLRDLYRIASFTTPA